MIDGPGFFRNTIISLNLVYNFYFNSSSVPLFSSFFSGAVVGSGLGGDGRL